ncbi:MAG: type II toxin-antitoxin system HicA family toxin [Treponema sp.]|nr:type II toxin-antitoxin system HicA family toxin [Treponema sp.]
MKNKLSQNGCYFMRHGRGDHDVWFSPITKLPITIDHKIVSRHTANGIMKRAGIKWHF